ncbi:MAG: selenide, water dikinase SelD, partial [Bryobacteraceae bacterium]
LEIEVEAVPLLPGALDYARAGALAAGLKNNRDFAACAVEVTRELPAGLLDLLYDPQTSGGLLVALPEGDAREFQRRFPRARCIGHVLERRERWIRIR